MKGSDRSAEPRMDDNGLVTDVVVSLFELMVSQVTMVVQKQDEAHGVRISDA